MGHRRKNRLHFRLTTWLFATVAFAAGGAMPVGTLSGDAGRNLVTFLGLVSASILPTISLILGSMTASGRSVKALNELHAELQAAMDALLFLFGLVAVSVIALVALSIPTPGPLANVVWAAETLSRMGQAIVAMAAILIVLKAGTIPGILRRSLGIRHEIAKDEARAKTLQKAPSAATIKEAFATHPDFGKQVDRDEGGREPH